MITLGSVGVDSVDVKAATARGIPVTNIPDTFIEEVADHAMMLLLAGFRRLVEQDKMVRTGRWSEGRPALLKIPRLMGQTLGFISFGRVARAVAKRAAPFGLRMMAYDPFIQETLMYDHGVIPSTLNEVLSQSDFVSMHAPARPEVHHMLTEKHFRQMKKSAVFINTGRGATVDEEALVKALQEGWIAHAALDVLEKEPPSHNNPMLSMENVTLTAHVASASARFDEARKRRVGYELSLVLSGDVAGKLRQSVGAAKHRASPLAARQHGSRPEQLGDEGIRTTGFTGDSTPGTSDRERSMRRHHPSRCVGFGRIRRGAGRDRRFGPDRIRHQGRRRPRPQAADREGRDLAHAAPGALRAGRTRTCSAPMRRNSPRRPASRSRSTSSAGRTSTSRPR